MKLNELHLREEQHYNIVSFERDDKPIAGTSKQGFIKAKYEDLVKLFGKPQNHTHDDKADVNFEWDLVIRYKDPVNDDHQNFDEDHDFVDVSIYDYRHGDEDRDVRPETITQWTVGAKSRTGMWVLDDLLASKGLK